MQFIGLPPHPCQVSECSWAPQAKKNHQNNVPAAARSAIGAAVGYSGGRVRVMHAVNSTEGRRPSGDLRDLLTAREMLAKCTEQATRWCCRCPL